MEAYAPIRVVNGGGSSRMEAYAPIRVVTGGGSSQMEPLAAIRVVTERCSLHFDLNAAHTVGERSRQYTMTAISLAT